MFRGASGTKRRQPSNDQHAQVRVSEQPPGAPFDLPHNLRALRLRAITNDVERLGVAVEDGAAWAEVAKLHPRALRVGAQASRSLREPP